MVKENLTGKQARIVGKTNSGKDAELYVSNEVDGKMHFRLGANNIFVSTETIKKVLTELEGK